MADEDVSAKSQQRSHPFCACNSAVSAIGLTLKSAHTLYFKVALMRKERSTNLIPHGGLRTAMIAPVLRLELAAVIGEFRATGGFFLCCHDAAQTTSLHTGVPKK